MVANGGPPAQGRCSPEEMIKTLTIGCLTVLALLVGTVLYHERPIIRSHEYSALVAHTNGTAYAATVFRPILMPDRLLVNVPGVTDARYNWFGVDLACKVVGAGYQPHRRFPGLLYVCRGMDSIGVGILDSKIEDEWTVEFSPSSIAFSNTWLSVRLEKD